MKSIVIADQVRIPDWLDDLASFRRWAASDEFPERGWFSYLQGELWVDLSLERLVHNRIKSELGGVLGNIVASEKLGICFASRMMLVNVKGDLATEPDGMFVSGLSLRENRVAIPGGDDAIEIIGSPDMTLEVVSPTSVQKDTVQLRGLYWQAGVREYWLVDSREKHFSFDIFRRGTAKFVAIRKNQGWIKSQVFGREFKLTESTTALNISEFTLEMR